MKRKALFQIALLGFSFLAIASAQTTTEPSSFEVSSTSTLTTEQFSTTGETSTSEGQFSTTPEEEATARYKEWQRPTPCYIEKSRAAELMTRMNQTVQIFNRHDEFLQCHDPLQIVKVDPNSVEMCSDERIQQVQKDLSDVAGRLIELAIRLSEPSAQDVDVLDLDKFRLIFSLKALRVFYGPSPCDSSSIVLYPFHLLVEHVEWNLDQKLALFNTPRSPRPTLPPTTTSTTPATATTTPKPTTGDMLLLDKTLQDLTALARLNPPAMTRAIPVIVSQRYNGRMSNFEDLLTFVQTLPYADNQVFGIAALHDEWRRNPTLDLPRGVKLADALRCFKSSLSLGSAASSKLTELLQKDELGPLVLTGEKALCQVTNVAYGRVLQVYDPKGYPESAYILKFSNQTNHFRIYPKLNSNKLNFHIQEGESPIYAADTNPNTENTIYTLKSSERYILEKNRGVATAKQENLEIEWKIVPVKNKSGVFKILSAKHEDFMFVHRDATGWDGGYRRVLLGRKGHSTYDHIPNADLWTLQCTPGTYVIPSD